MKNIYLIVGKSGSGKDTIVNALCEKYGYKRLISYTTRHQRSDPADEKSHIFVDMEDYRCDRDNGQIVAETFYNGNYYWATKKQVDESDLYIIDIPGVKSIRERYFGKPAVVIAVEADDETRIRRMKLRGDSLTSITARMTLDKEEFKELYELMDFIVANGRLKDGTDIPINNLVDCLHNIIQCFENKVVSSIQAHKQITPNCIDCTTIGVDTDGKWCPKTRNKLDKMAVLSDVMKAVDGYRMTDTVPISGRLLYNIAAVLGDEI